MGLKKLWGASLTKEIQPLGKTIHDAGRHTVDKHKIQRPGIQ